VYRVGLRADGNDECCSTAHVYNMHILWTDWLKDSGLYRQTRKVMAL
jgi:hypothetical protein